MTLKKTIIIIVSAVLACGVIGLCVGLGVHFGKKDKPVTAGNDNFYLLDAKHDWKWSDNNRFDKDDASDLADNVITQYAYTAFFDKDEEVKVWKGSDDWKYNNPEQAFDFIEQGENIKITKAGTYRFYLKLYTDGGNSLYIEKKDETDASNLYVDYLRFDPLRSYDETKLNEYDKFRIAVYSAPNYNGSGYYTPLFLDNPLKTGKPVVYSGTVGYKKEYDGETQYLPYTLTLMANKDGGVEITLNGSELIHIETSGYASKALGLIYKY